MITKKMIITDLLIAAIFFITVMTILYTCVCTDHDIFWIVWRQIFHIGV